MKHIWRVLAAGTVLSVAQPLLADVKAGVDAWQQGDYARAVGEWQPLAKTGDPDAQFNMGQAYKLGRGVQANLDTAMQWYRKAAAQGHLRASDNLGLLLFQRGDRAGALPYLQQAADRGEPRAQYIVGTALFNGDLAAKNWVRAYALMTRAADAGLAQATASLKQMDKFIPQDQRIQGVALARRMAEQEQAQNLTGGISRPDEPLSRPAPSSVRTVGVPASQPPAPETAAPRQAPIKTADAPPAAKPKAAPVKAAAAKPALPPAVNGGGWRVQIGAFSAESRARSMWSQLSAKVRGLSSYQPFILTSGGVTRLQAGPLANSADASRLCGTIKAAGADCIPKKM